MTIILVHQNMLNITHTPTNNYAIIWDPNVEQDTFQYYKRYDADGKLTIMWYQNGIDSMSNVIKSIHRMYEKYNTMSHDTTHDITYNMNDTTNNVGVHSGCYLDYYQINGVPELPNVNLIPFRGEENRQLIIIGKYVDIGYYKNGNLSIIFISIKPNKPIIYNFNEQGQRHIYA